MTAIEHIRTGRLIAIVRAPQVTPQTATALTEVLVEAGVRALEFTLDTAGAVDGIHAAASTAGDRATVGAGTVLRREQVDQAAEAGAQFIVSPDVSPDVIERSNELALTPLPGAFTATEIRRAVDCGAALVKLFPAQPVGPGYLRALRGPLSDVELVPTGGLKEEDVAPFLAAGAVAVALGSSLVGSVDDLAEVSERARRAVAVAAAAPRP